MLDGNAEDKSLAETNPPQQVISKKVFRMAKPPIFLGVFADDQEKSRKKVTNILKYVLAQVSSGKSDHSSQVAADLKELKEGLFEWKWPETHHITTYFVGKDKTKTTDIHFREFSEGVRFPYSIKHVVYIPGKIATGLTFPNRELLHIENEFPHVTLLYNTFPPKTSNDILVTLFGGFLKAKYQQGLNLGPDKHLSLSVEIDGNSEEVIIYQLPEEVYFQATTKTF